MYAAFKWRAVSFGHDELRYVLFLINGTVIADHFREQGDFAGTGSGEKSIGAEKIGIVRKNPLYRAYPINTLKPITKKDTIHP
jgi:hypothetical protein